MKKLIFVIITVVVLGMGIWIGSNITSETTITYLTEEEYNEIVEEINR